MCRWLIAIAYWLSGGFIKSGLGNRIAYAIVSVFGKTTLGLTYSLVFAEALLAPAIPSVCHTLLSPCQWPLLPALTATLIQHSSSQQLVYQHPFCNTSAIDCLTVPACCGCCNTTTA